MNRHTYYNVKRAKNQRLVCIKIKTKTEKDVKKMIALKKGDCHENTKR